jgi:hypothetical protein
MTYYQDLDMLKTQQPPEQLQILLHIYLTKRKLQI